jgi:phage terminase large subunit GpA-like protein
VPLWPVGSDTVKGVLSARLREEGFIHFPAGLDTSYYEQLASERMVVKFRSGVPFHTWIKTAGARNEAWDCMVYAYAAAVREGLKRANWRVLGARLKAWDDGPPRAAMIAEQQTERASGPLPVSKPRRTTNNGFGSDDWVL